MNYTNFIVKIVSKPQQSFFKNKKIIVTEFIGKVYKFQNKKNFKNKPIPPCKISIWGNLGSEIPKKYAPNDFLIVEGYISFRKCEFEDLNIKTEIEISVLKFYPFVRKSISLEK